MARKSGKVEKVDYGGFGGADRTAMWRHGRWALNRDFGLFEIRAHLTQEKRRLETMIEQSPVPPHRLFDHGQDWETFEEANLIYCVGQLTKLEASLKSRKDFLIEEARSGTSKARRELKEFEALECRESFDSDELVDQ
jgi:hypothetical protein